MLEAKYELTCPQKLRVFIHFLETTDSYGNQDKSFITW